MPIRARSGPIAASPSVLGGCEVKPAPASATATPAAARPAAASFQRGAPSGKRQQVASLAALNPDRSSLGQISCGLTSGPAHGTVDFAEIGDFGYRSQPSPRSKCNDRRVPGTGVFYASEPGFRGTDGFVVSRATANGFRYVWPVTVTVR